MNQTEKNARKAHGDPIYWFTWKARSETNPGKKWLYWHGIFLIHLLDNFSLWAMTVLTIFFGPYILLLWVIVIGVHIEGTPMEVISVCSDFFSVASDAKRQMKSIWGKIFYAPVFIVSASFAVLYATLVWNHHRQRDSFKITELDVLGNIFSKAKLWKWAREIFSKMEKFLSYPEEGRAGENQVAISYALACKWMLDDPKANQDDKGYYISMIQKTLELYELEPEVTLRFYEALGDKVKMEEARAAIQRKVASA